VHGSRGRGLLAAGLTACALVAAYRALNAAPDPSLVARWWPATALVTVLFLMLPRQAARGFTFLATTGFFAIGLLAGRDVVFSLGFAVANIVEVLVVVWWLTKFEEGVPRLHSWSDYRRWLVGICLGSAAAGLITAGTLWIADGAHGDAPWRTLLWIAVTHGGAQALVLPLVMQQQQHRIRVSALEISLHAVLMITALSACIASTPGQPVAFLLLPVLMWGAARFPHLWSNLELVGVALAFAVLSALGQGPFPDVSGRAPLLTIAASAQVFVLISAITAVAFSVATSHLRDSLRRLRENELQLGQLLDSASGTAFIATDLEGVITWFSPGAEQLLAHRSADLVGRATPIRFHEPRELVTRARELGIPATTYEVITGPLQRGEEQDTRDWTYVRQDGGRLTVSLSVTAVRDDAGKPQSYLSVVRDVTDRRAAEQALLAALDKEREANRRMHEVDRAKDDFVSSVSHELRTPLTSIVGYTELLTEGLTGPMTEMQADLIEKIDRNGGRLLNLVEDLLTLSRVENGSFRLDSAPTDLRDAVRGATAEVTSAAQRQGVAMSVIVPPEPVTVVGDGQHLERLVLNLVSNAVKFTDRGGLVRVGLEVHHGVAVLSVTDTGMGIPYEEQANLFQRFFRSSVATERAIQGTGLGLNIAQSIAQAHQGSVDFESTPGVGTTFRFSVPLKGPVILPAGAQAGHDGLLTNRAIGNLFSPRHRSPTPRSEVS
jgi:PAS domain S-box-containing protein